MKRGAFLVFLLILAAAAQAAIYEEQIFNEEITSSGAYTGSNGENFTIQLIGDSINVGLQSGATIVKNGTCETSGNYEVCLLITGFSHYDYTGPEKIVNKRDITIKARVAKLNLTRTIEKTEFWMGEETEVRMRMQNIGERTAAVSFLDNFSGAFDVALPLTCDVKDNAVSWKGELKSNEVVACNYRIKAAKAGSFISAATAAYNNGVAEATETDSATLTVKDFPLKLSSNLSGQGIELGSEVTALFEMNATENMTVKSLRIFLPEGLRLLGRSGIGKAADGALEYAGTLNAGSSSQFTITFAAEKTGTLPIKEATRIVLTDTKLAQNFEREIIANISVEELYTRILKPNLSSGANTLDIFVVNPSEQNFYNVELNIETGLPLKSARATFPKIENLGHEEFSTGFDAATGTYPVTTTLTYSSIYGETFSVITSENVTVAGEAEEATVSEAQIKDSRQEERAGIEPKAEESQRTGFKIEKSEFSAKAALIATAIVVVVAGMLVLISARKKKQEVDEF